MKKNSAFIFGFVFVFGAVAPAVFAQTTPPNSSSGSGTSVNWSGYAATSGVYTAVSGTWNIPTPTVSANTPISADATWVGIGGVTGTDLIQAGTENVIQNGALSVEAWVETLPNYQQIIPLSVRDGDSVDVSLSEQSAGQWLLIFTDNTTGQNYTQTITYDSSLSSAEWIEEMPASISGRGGTSFVPLDNFGSAQFTNAGATKDGVATTIFGAGANPITMMINGVALATPSALSADGASFSVSRSNVTVTSSQQPIIQRQGRGFRRSGVGLSGYSRSSRTAGRLFFRRMGW